MQLTSLIGHASELVRIIRKSPQPGDAIASEYFRSKKYIGATDRRFISGLVFTALRTLSLSEALQKKYALEDVVHGAHLLMTEPESIDAEWLASLPLHVRVCTQDWLLESTRSRWGDDAPLVWESLKNSAPLSLRVNLRRASRQNVIDQLRRENIDATPGTLSPASIIVHQRVNLQQHPLYLNGIVEVQDEGSQLIGYACAPLDTDRILDACAGAGGKALHLADIQNDRGSILAHDIEWKRLKEVPKRAQRAGMKSITITTNLDQGATPAARSRARDTEFDLVLVDAPCSGMGTVRRLPMVKWRITPDTLARHARKQFQVLEQYAPYVREDGFLVYATCSILPEENERVVESFLSKHPEFAPDPLAPCFAQYGINLPQLGKTDYTFQADPYHHGTDGLFVARMRKSADITESRDYLAR